jgi:hypothetical protein
MFQFAFDGALFTLKQKRPEATPLSTLPPEIRAHAHTVPMVFYIVLLLFIS